MGCKIVALLGDSILDNSPYVRPNPDTTAHLRDLPGESRSVELLAEDGSSMTDIPLQMKQVSVSTACAGLSVGGNDAIEHIGLLGQEAHSAEDVLEPLVNIGDVFGRSCQSLVAMIRPRVLRLTLCTIHEPPLRGGRTARLARLGPEAFVEEIEPSPQGARKVAASLAARSPHQPMPDWVGCFAV